MPSDPQRTPASDRGHSVLVIEDSDDLREVLVQFLDIAGLDAVGFGDAGSALDELEARRYRPRAIVLDLGMPAMSGEEFLRDRKNVPGLVRVPVVVITGKPVASDHMRALGVAEVVPKPFEPGKLVETVKRVIAN